jgi:uncharacterized repeat protein (TIGR01451 family)
LLVKLIVVLGGVSVLAWAGFFLLTQGLFHNEEMLSLTVEGPEDVKSGEEATFTFRYENTGDVPIAALAMQLQVPDSFHLFVSIPEPSEPRVWTIGALNPKSDGAISITGVFLAEVPSSQRIQGLFTYKPANFNSDFQDIASHKVEIKDSVVALSFTGPEKALAGDVSEYVVNIQNISTDPVFNLRVVPTLPQDFTLSESDPALTEGQTYWSIPALDPGELYAITINGAFTSTASGEQKVSATVGFVDQDLFLPQATEEVTTDVLGGSVAFSIIVNGSDKSQSAQLGETLRLSIDYANASAETVKDLEFEMNVTPGVPPLPEGGLGGVGVPIKWSGANLGEGSRNGNTITWNDSNVDGLDRLEPDSSGVIDVSLPIVAELAPDQADNFTITLTLTIGSVGSVTSTRTIETTPIVISLNSDTRISAWARYFNDEGIAIGEGPLPPRVGETTGYRVYWSLSNSLHALEGVRMSTTLPQNVAWLESTDTSIGKLLFNSTTRQVTWDIIKLPTEVENAGAWFSVAINPDDDDVGQFMKLTNSTSFSAKDFVTGEAISASVDELTTELAEDDFAEGKGIVVD